MKRVCKTLRKGFMSLILTGALVLGAVPVDGFVITVHAGTTPEEINVSTQTLEDGHTYITKEGDNAYRITVNGNVTLILRDGTTFNAKNGFEVQSGGMLTILGDSEGTGKLVVNAKRNPDPNGNTTNIGSLTAIAGNVTIYGGTVEATGWSGANGKSNGESADEAKGGLGGHGIGGDGATVKIYGGTVNATGGNGGNGGKFVNSSDMSWGYPGGDGGDGICGTVIIDGGTVTASGGNGGTGASGKNHSAGGGKGGHGINGSVTMQDGRLTANGGTGGSGASGMNGGNGGDAIHGDCAGHGILTANPGTGGTKGGSGGSNGASGKAISGTDTLERHEHSFTWSADGDTITAKCTDDCWLTDHKATLTIHEPDSLIYDKSIKTVRISGDTDILGTPAITCNMKNTNTGEYTIPDSPLGRGSYCASITVGGVTASVYFAIIKAADAPTITTQPADLNILTGAESGNILSVAAAEMEGHTLSYQWYSNTTDSNQNGTLIDGATDASLTVPTSNEDTIYYYCVVTATRTEGQMTATAVSNTAGVRVSSNLPQSYTVSITVGANMTKTDTSGAASQSVDTGNAMTDVVYTADEGFYFPADYNVNAVNRISVTRDSYTQITVSGTPVGDASLTLAACTAKTKPDAPETPTKADCTTASNDDGKLIGVTEQMEYKKSDAAAWTTGTVSDITGLSPGTYYVRFRETDTTLPSDNMPLVISGYAAPDQVAAPTFSPAAGTYTEAQNITISCETTEAEVYYTTDGTDPTASSLRYTGAISVTKTTTIKAIAVKNGMTNSAVSTATYTITDKPAPVITKAPTARNLTYNGQAQALVEAGTAEGGTMQYALGENATTAPADNLYTISIPTATDVGTYYIWYKVKGDGNHNDSGVYGPVTVTIGEDKPTTYEITVGNGTADKEKAASGETVTIKAAAAPTGQVFDKWMSEDDVTFADAQSEETTFVMPGKAVTVTATYKDKSSQSKPDDNIQPADYTRPSGNTQSADNPQPTDNRQPADNPQPADNAQSQQADNTSALDNNTQTKTEVTENNDGSTTKTTTETKANEDFTQTVVTTGADGNISETVTSKVTDAQTGTVTETRTEKSADGSTEENVKITQTNGDITELNKIKAVDGSSEETKKVTGADGSFTQTSTSTNSTGVVTETRTDTHEVAANGSASETSTIISSGTTTEQKLTIGESGQVTSAELTVTNTNGKETAVSLTAGTNGLVLKDVDSDAKNVKIPDVITTADGKTVPITKVDKDAFDGNDKLKKLTLGSNVNKIAAGALEGHGKLTRLTLNGSNIRFGKDCLKGTGEKLVIIVRSNKEKRNIRSQLAKAGNPNATVIVEKK